MTVGEAMDRLLMQRGMYRKDLAVVLKVGGPRVGQIIRGEKELTFLMAVRLLEYFELSMDEFVSLLDQQELERQELTRISLRKRKLDKAGMSV